MYLSIKADTKNTIFENYFLKVDICHVFDKKNVVEIKTLFTF